MKYGILGLLIIAIIAYAETYENEWQLLNDFEKSFVQKYDCDEHIYRCIQERKTAKDAYFKKHGKKIEKPKQTDDELRSIIMNEYNDLKGQREIIVKEGNSYRQVIKPEEQKKEKNLQEHIAEGLIKFTQKVMGADRMQAQLTENSNRRLKLMKENNRKALEKNKLCHYWINNQDGSEIKKQYKKQACGF